MKKLTALLLALLMLLSLCACGNQAEDAGVKSYKIGICNYVDDASLNQIVDSIRARLEEIGAEKQLRFEILYDNCNADPNVLAQIIANFQAENVDLMIAVATPVALAMQAATEDSGLPVVFAAVSDPLGCGLVESMEAPGGNLTGTSDYLNTAAIMNLIFAANPEISCVGLLYDAGQDASTAAIADAKAALSSRGVRIVERTGTNVDEISLAVDALIADGAEAVFTPTDNTVMTAELTIYEKLAAAGIPHYTGADSFALNGAFLGYGVDYANLGRVTGEMAAELLLSGASPAGTPVRTFDNGTATVNTETCAALGLDYETVAAAFAPYCTRVQTITTANSFDELN